MEREDESPTCTDLQETFNYENPTPRSLKSLHLLTTKFVHLLQEAKDGEVDLREALRVMAFAQKRRIYDITNVLEGTGLIVKKSKNVVKWLGSTPGRNGHQTAERISSLQAELEDLKRIEDALDQQRLWVEQSIRNTKEDCSGLTYVNHEDICNCFSGHTLLAVRAPFGTQLDVPIPKAVQDSPPQYQIHLKSVEGPIDIVFMNKDSVSADPVVLPVPPPEDILHLAKLAMLASEEKGGSPGQGESSASTKPGSESESPDTKERHPLHKSPLGSAEPGRTTHSALHELTKELRERISKPKEFLSRLLTSDVLSPLLHLPSPLPEPEYACHRDEPEGASSHFDVPALSV